MLLWSFTKTEDNARVKYLLLLVFLDSVVLLYTKLFRIIAFSSNIISYKVHGLRVKSMATAQSKGKFIETWKMQYMMIFNGAL